MENSKIKLALIDDDNVVCHCFKTEYDKAESDIDIIFTCNTYKEFKHYFDVAANEKPDVVLVDMNLGIGAELDGLKILEYIKDTKLECRPIVLTSHKFGKNIREAARALGAQSWLEKGNDFLYYADVIKRVSKGWEVFPPIPENEKWTEIDIDFQKNYDSLTTQQKKVFREYAIWGNKVKVGKVLNIAPTTVADHLTAIGHTFSNYTFNGCYVAHIALRLRIVNLADIQFINPEE